jgi:hypothetical protein
MCLCLNACTHMLSTLLRTYNWLRRYKAVKHGKAAKGRREKQDSERKAVCAGCILCALAGTGLSIVDAYAWGL